MDVKSNSHCLIVGVSNYPKPISKLPAVANDLREMASLLSSPEGVFSEQGLTVIIDEAVTGSALTSALENVFRKATANDEIFVYIAGHGSLSREGDYYYIPYDVNLQHLRETAIPLVTIRNLFEECASHTVLLWLDFCHSGGITSRHLNSLSNSDVNAVIERTLKVSTGTGKVIMCACSPVQFAYEDRSHGYFTKHLLSGLRGAAANHLGEVTVNSLHDYITEQIGSSLQQPVLFGKITGKMVLMYSRNSSAPQVASSEGVSAINDSGQWLMLDSNFFEADNVKTNREGVIVARIRSAGAEDDTVIHSLQLDCQWQQKLVRFAYRNNALIVRVSSIENEVDINSSIRIITLRPEPIEYGVGFKSDIDLEMQGRKFSTDEIAELRARHLLLNDPPPPNEKRSSVTKKDEPFEMMIQGSNAPYPANVCVFTQLYPVLRSDPENFLKKSRLAAIFALKAGQVFEYVSELKVGPILEDRMHVRCRGGRKKAFWNVPPTEIIIEGDCLLT